MPLAIIEQLSVRDGVGARRGETEGGSIRLRPDAGAEARCTCIYYYIVV
jgi:hypothetical protein